ncbi:MAG: carboxypeptidase regulatory-like domain-containing protein, partial [Thermoplasmata archaeon]|nr:carboxypeptidase regulatory-like domain-containing protein [Thermoplasmata archaeon]
VQLSGITFWDHDGNSVYDEGTDAIIPGAEVVVSNYDLIAVNEGITDPDGRIFFENMVPGSAVADISIAGRYIASINHTLISGQPSIAEWAIAPTSLRGVVYDGYGEPVVGASIDVWIDDQNVTQTISGINGTFSFNDLLYGGYYIQAIYDGQATRAQMINIDYLANNTIDLVMNPAVLFSGTVIMPDGSKAPDANIRLTYGNLPEEDILLSTNSLGEFKEHLEADDYIIYCSYPMGGKEYVHASRLELNANTTFEIELKEGIQVSGKIIRSDFEIPGDNIRVIFTDIENDFVLEAFSNSEGDFIIDIPIGTYDIYSYLNFGDDELVYASRISLDQSHNDLNIELKEAFRSPMTIYQDYNGNDEFDIGEGLEDVTIEYRMDNDQVITSFTDPNGASELTLYKGRFYTVIISKEGYDITNLGRRTDASLTTPLFEELVPKLVPIDGTIFLGDDVLLNENAYVHFTVAGSDTINFGAIDSSVQMEQDGTYHAELIPGIYSVNIMKNVTTGNDSEILQIDEIIDLYTGLYTGEAVELNITVRQRVKFNMGLMKDGLATDGNVSFIGGPDERGFDISIDGSDIYLEPGDYIVRGVYAIEDRIYMANEMVNISEGIDLTVTLEESYNLNGRVFYEVKLFEGYDIIFTDLETNDTIVAVTDENSDYNVHLVRNKEYRVDMSFLNEDDVGFSFQVYRYFLNPDNATTTVKVSTAGNEISKNLNLNRERYYIDLLGNVTLSVANSSDVGTELKFASEREVYLVTTDKDGYYRTEIPPGAYDVYAYNPGNNDVYLQSIGLGSFEKIILDIELETGYGLSGEVYFNLNQNQITTLDFVSDNGKTNLTTGIDGHYNIWLPENSYNITGELINEENNLDITYSLNTVIEIDDDLRRNLPLTKVEIFDLIVESKALFSGIIIPEMYVEYEITVTNIGNAPDTYNLFVSGGESGWNPVIETAKMELGYGDGGTAKTKVSFTIPEGALVNYNPVTITVASSKSAGLQETVTLTADIQQYYGLELNYSMTPMVIDGPVMKWSVGVKNTGNGDDMVAVYIANLDDLASKGWRVVFDNSTSEGDIVNDGTEIHNISLSPNIAKSLPLKFEQIGDNPFKTVEVLIGTYSHTDTSIFASKSLDVVYPRITLGENNITVSGDSVHDTTTEHPLVGGVVTIIAVTIGLTLFYVMKKRRWLR